MVDARDAVTTLVAALLLGGGACAPLAAVAQEAGAPAPLAPPPELATPAAPRSRDAFPSPATLPRVNELAPEVKQAMADSPPSRRFRIRASDYGALAVQSRDAETFYYIRQDHYQALAATDAERIARLTSLRSFGPNPTNSRFSVRYGENYVFLPVCAGKPSPKRLQLGRTLRGERDISVKLSCR